MRTPFVTNNDSRAFAAAPGCSTGQGDGKFPAYALRASAGKPASALRARWVGSIRNFRHFGGLGRRSAQRVGGSVQRRRGLLFALVGRLGMDRVTGRVGEHRSAAVVAEFEREAVRVRDDANNPQAAQRGLDF